MWLFENKRLLRSVTLSLCLMPLGWHNAFSQDSADAAPASSAPAPFVRRETFSSVDDALAYAKQVLEKPIKKQQQITPDKVTLRTIDSVEFNYTPGTRTGGKLSYSFHSVTEITDKTDRNGAPDDTIATTVVDMHLETDFKLLDLAAFNPTVNSESGMDGIDSKLLHPDIAKGTVSTYIIKKDGQRINRGTHDIEQPIDKVFFISYDADDRRLIMKSLYQAQVQSRLIRRPSKSKNYRKTSTAVN